MVVRKEKTNRKYLGTRRWGAGNIKNARGKGDRGGVGKAGMRKHKWTYMTAKTPELIKTVGFAPWKKVKLKEITLRSIDLMLAKSGEKRVLEFRNYKVLSNGSLSKPVTIKASGFSASAMEKIKNAGGEAVKF
ncbi:MAG: uL15m family ribosomal protein [Candidatus Micrarchaeaceae archaeon]|jgi:large subunit ribosomal protein L15